MKTIIHVKKTQLVESILLKSCEFSGVRFPAGQLVRFPIGKVDEFSDKIDFSKAVIIEVITEKYDDGTVNVNEQNKGKYETISN